MKTVEIPDWIMRDLRENKYLEPDDESRDKEILELEGEEFLDAWLTWNGICGFTRDIIEAIYYAYGIDLELGPVITRVKRD